MDYLAEHWPWLSAVILAVGKMINDHFKIQNHDNRIEDLEKVMQEERRQSAAQSENIKHIRDTVDALAERMGVTEEDIKKLIRNR